MVRVAAGKQLKNQVHKKPDVPAKNYCLPDRFIEFCNRTELHGYKYIVMADFNKVERCCWALAVLTSIAVAAYFVITAYNWFARNPIVTVIESTQGAIWDVPFPAVTICNLNVVSKQAARTYANKLKLLPNVTADFVFETFRLIPLLLSNFKSSDHETQQLSQLQDILDFNNITIKTLFETLSPAYPCSKLVQNCMWKNSVYRCGELFKPVFTLLGICCTFNYFAVEDKSHLIVNSNHVQPTHVPSVRRVASCGYQTALTVLLYTNTEDYYSASIATQGAVVIIDNAYNVPDQDSPVRMVIPSTEVLIAMSPEWTYATSGVRDFSPEERQCYYDGEIKIGKFQKYSYHNCMAFKKVEKLKAVCGCVPIFFPAERGCRTCSFKDMICVQNTLYSKSKDSSEISTESFQCLPECEHYDYPLEVALSKVTKSDYMEGLPFENASLMNRSLLNVFFNDLVSTRYRRDVYLNWQNILAAFGGLLSLMLGFTLISGLDLILFLIVRVFYNSCTLLHIRNKMRNQANVQKFPRKGWIPQGNIKKHNDINLNDKYDRY